MAPIDDRVDGLGSSQRLRERERADHTVGGRIGAGILDSSFEAEGSDALARMRADSPSATVARCLALAQKGVFDVYQSHLKALTGDIVSGAQRSRAYVSHMSKLIQALRTWTGTAGASSSGAFSVDTLDHWAATVAMYLARTEGKGAASGAKALVSNAEDDIAAALEDAGMSDDIAGDVAASLVSSVYFAATLSGTHADDSIDIGAIVRAAAQKLPAELGRCIDRERAQLVECLRGLNHDVRSEVHRALTSSSLDTRTLETIDRNLFKSGADTPSEHAIENRKEERVRQQDLDQRIELERQRTSMV